LLRPGGHLIVSTPNAVNLYALAKQFYPDLHQLFVGIDNEAMDTGTHTDHLYSWDIFTLYRLLHRTGFIYEAHAFAGLHIPFIGMMPFSLPMLSRLSRTMILKARRA
jgi:hypothetical protein